MSSPYLIEGPALISFSGGRTSAFMLHQILDAHGGTLPPDVIVTFANTGKEREETLAFVHECETRWAVPVLWLEWRPDGYERVSFASASREGEPFAGLIEKKGYLPNAVTRFCTSELKVRVMKAHCLSLGWTHWTNVVGLRYDEGHRVLKQLAANDAGKDRWHTAMPLSKARVTKRDVMAFWSAQPFDLGLEPYEGNCDLCMLKSRGALKRLIRDRSGIENWWSAQEQAVTARGNRPSGSRFVTEYSFADLRREVDTQPFMPGLLDEEYDVECGLTCEPVAA